MTGGRSATERSPSDAATTDPQPFFSVGVDSGSVPASGSFVVSSASGADFFAGYSAADCSGSADSFSDFPLDRPPL